MKFMLFVLFAAVLWTGMEIAFQLGRTRGHLDRAAAVPCAPPADGWSR